MTARRRGQEEKTTFATRSARAFRLLIPRFLVAKRTTIVLLREPCLLLPFAIQPIAFALLRQERNVVPTNNAQPPTAIFLIFAKREVNHAYLS